MVLRFVVDVHTTCFGLHGHLQVYCRLVLRLVVAVLHYMFRPTWPSSGVYDVSLLHSFRNTYVNYIFIPTGLIS
jgi:hypothetical protein